MRFAAELGQKLNKRSGKYTNCFGQRFWRLWNRRKFGNICHLSIRTWLLYGMCKCVVLYLSWHNLLAWQRVTHGELGTACVHNVFDEDSTNTKKSCLVHFQNFAYCRCICYCVNSTELQRFAKWSICVFNVEYTDITKVSNIFSSSCMAISHDDPFRSSPIYH